MSPSMAARALLLVAPLLAWTTPGHAADAPDTRTRMSAQEWAAGRAQFRPRLKPPEAPAAGDEYWSAEFGLPSPDGILYCAARFGNDLIVGGSFQQIGGVPVNNIARWDGTAWHAMGDGTSDRITCMTVYDGSLYVGGRFQYVEGRFSPNIAKWDGHAWTPVGLGLGTYYCCYDVKSLAVYQGDLVAGGDFGPAQRADAQGIARWDGATWRPFGDGVGGVVQTMQVVGDSLYVGGLFSMAGGVPSANVALWDGAAWSPLGQGTNGTRWAWGVRALALYHGRLFAGGDFDSAGGQPAQGLASWDGTSWSPAPHNDSGLITALAVHNDTLAVAVFPDMLLSDGVAWIGELPGLRGGPTQLLSDPSGLIAVGSLNLEDASSNARGFGVARWDGQSWRGYEPWDARMKGLAMFAGMPAHVSCLASFQGDLIAGGLIDFAGTGTGWARAGTVERWDGAGWTPMVDWWLFGSGLARALLSDGDTLYAAGRFGGLMPGWPQSTVLRWSEGSWTALDTLSYSGSCLSKYRGRLMVGIARSQSDQPPDGGVFAWNGAGWDRIGPTGGPFEFQGVYSMTVHEGLLVAAGQFASIGGVPASGFAAWDGTTWRAFGGPGPQYAYPPSPWIAGVASYQGYLVAAGDFLGPHGDVPLVVWDGSTWTPIEGITGYARSMSVVRGSICVSGNLHLTALSRDATVAIGTLTGGWWPLGSGLNAPPDAIIEHDGAVCFGGYFSEAGGRSAFGIARWNGLGPVPQPPTPWLSPGRPNPFVAGADFSIQLGHPGKVRVAVYDVRGREVAILDTSDRPAGTYTTRWDGRDRAGQPAPAGVYFINVRDAAGATSSRKIVRLR